MKIIFLTLLCVQLGTSLISPVLAQGYRQQIARFDSLLFRSNMSKAEQGYLSLLPIANKNNHEHLRLNCLIGLYRVATTRSQRNQADSLLAEIRSIFYDKGLSFDAETRLKFYATASQRLSDEGDLLESLEMIKRAESFIDSIKTDPSHSKELILFAKGTCLIRMSDYANAEKVFKNVLEICQNSMGDHHPYLTFVYNVLGIVSKENLKFEAAIEYYVEGFRMISKRPSIPKRHYVSLTYNICNAYINIEEYDSALYYGRLSLKNEQAQGQGQTINLGRSYAQLARIFFELGQTDSAFQYINKSITILEGLNYINLGISLNRAGLFYRKSGNYKKAEEMYLRALKDFNKRLSVSNDRVRMLLNELARFYLELKDFTQAHQKVDSAIGLSFGGIEKVRQFAKEPTEDVEIPIDLIESLIAKSEIYLAQGISLEKDAFILKSRTYLDLATIMIDVKQKSIPIRESPFFYDLRKEIVDVRVRCYLQSHKTTLTDADHIDLLSEIERIKADRHFYQLIRDHHTSFDDVSTGFIAYEEEVKSRMVYLKNQLLKDNAMDKRQSDNFKSELFKLKQSYDAIENAIKHKAPNFYTLKYALAKDGIENAFKHWPKGLYSIHFFDTGENLYVSHLTKDKKKISVIKNQEHIKEFALHAPSPADKNLYSKWDLAYQLYHELLDTALIHGINKIEIIPDGPVWNVNFDLLLTERPQSNDLKSMPYLFKEYAISYTYSASLPLQDRTRKKGYKKNLLAFSFGETDKAFGNQLTLRNLASSKNELPGSRAEVRAISEEINGDYFYGSYANEEQFKAIAHDYKVLHLALHGDTDDKKPENSKLYFYSKGNAKEDGMLHAFELYHMNLKAELAVLSACNTGSGEIVKGEGIMSLGRAFEYAGVNSLLLTRHEVSDAVTPEIMKVFYRELKKGKRKSEALQQAKLEFLENAKGMPSHPYFWSSFYILGDDAPIIFENEIDYWKWISVALAFIFAAFLFFRKIPVAK